jgi:hypothetical protein
MATRDTVPLAHELRREGLLTATYTKRTGNQLVAPVLSIQLLNWLETLYPEKSPQEDETERALMVRAGTAKVVRRLREEWERQQKQ